MIDEEDEVYVANSYMYIVYCNLENKVLVLRVYSHTAEITKAMHTTKIVSNDSYIDHQCSCASKRALVCACRHAYMQEAYRSTSEVSSGMSCSGERNCSEAAAVSAYGEAHEANE